MYQINMDFSNIIKIIGIIIAIVIVSSIVIIAVKATGERMPSICSLFFGGIAGKLTLTLIVVSVGCVAIRFITGMVIFTIVAKICIALCVVVFMLKIISQIFSK